LGPEPPSAGSPVGLALLRARGAGGCSGGSEHPCPTPRQGGGSALPGVPASRRRPDAPLPGSEEPVEPRAEAKLRLDLVPCQAGLCKLVVDFESDKLTGVKGYRNVIIAPQPQ